MKSILVATLAALVISAPVASAFAQDNSTPTAQDSTKARKGGDAGDTGTPAAAQSRGGAGAGAAGTGSGGSPATTAPGHTPASPN